MELALGKLHAFYVQNLAHLGTKIGYIEKLYTFRKPPIRRAGPEFKAFCPHSKLHIP